MEEVPQIFEQLYAALNALRECPAYTQQTSSIESHIRSGERLADRVLAAGIDASLGGVRAERKHQDLERRWQTWLARTQVILAMPGQTEPLRFP